MSTQHTVGPAGATASAAAGALAEPTATGEAMWTVRRPAAWPNPPSPLSYTVLRDIEACPLRWALRRGHYPEVGTGVGYPSAPPLATVAGQVVHGALERIVREVGRVSYGDGRSDSATQVASGRVVFTVAGESDSLGRVVAALRALGGITAVLESVLADVVQDWSGNPRIAPRAREWEAELRRQLPALRQRVQQLLAQVDLGYAITAHRASDFARADAMRSVSGPHPREVRLHALSPGIYAEVPLSDPELDWYGKADILRVMSADGDADPAGGCEIVDFKTGAAKEDHALQLRIYAILWAHDRRLNPTGQVASRLTLVYQSRTVTVVPPADGAELDALATELRERSAAVRAAIAARPPEPRPSRVACEWCDVRQMCETYWAPATRAAVKDSPAPTSMAAPHAPPTGSDGLTDVEFAILAVQGPWSWLARVTAVGALTADVMLGARILVRAQVHDAHFVRLLSVGARARIITAQYLAPTEESGGLPVIALTRSTEAFVLAPAEETGGRA